MLECFWFIMSHKTLRSKEIFFDSFTLKSNGNLKVEMLGGCEK